MKTTVTALSLAVALFVSGSALADNPNPDATAPKPVAPPHLFLSVAGGASVSSVDVFEGGTEVHYISEHAHVGLGIGHEVWAAALGTDRISVALGYAGSFDFNADEMLHSHAFGVTLRKSWFFVTLDGGVAVLNGFKSGDNFVGGHFGLDWGFRIGPVQIAFPISTDVFNAPAYTCAATLGFQI